MADVVDNLDNRRHLDLTDLEIVLNHQFCYFE